MTSGQTNSIYCAHCGTGNEPNASICDRCGERVYRPNVDQPPPLGLAACGKCNDANEAQAFYCVNCGHSMESAVRISPEGATSSSRAAEQPQTSRRITKPDPPAPQRRTPEPRASVVTQKSVRPQGVAEFDRFGCRKRVWGSRRRTARIAEGIQLGGFSHGHPDLEPVQPGVDRAFRIGSAQPSVPHVYRVPVKLSHSRLANSRALSSLDSRATSWHGKARSGPVPRTLPVRKGPGSSLVPRRYRGISCHLVDHLYSGRASRNGSVAAYAAPCEYAGPIGQISTVRCACFGCRRRNGGY